MKVWYNRPLTEHEQAMITFVNACRANNKEVPSDIRNHLEEIGLWEYKHLHIDLRAEINVYFSSSKTPYDPKHLYFSADLIPDNAISVMIDVEEG